MPRELSGFVDIFCKKESLGFSIRQQGFKPSQTKEFVGAGLARPLLQRRPNSIWTRNSTEPDGF
jgi:hypothetical protein